MNSADFGDSLEIFGLVEDGQVVEDAMLAEIRRAQDDESARLVLEQCYLEGNRDRAFDRFQSSAGLHATLRLLDSLRVTREMSIVELGGGAGWLAWALHRQGFRVELVEPNGCYVTGTGYLRSRTDARDLPIWNDLAAWYASGRRYDLVLTQNCVHHFPSLPHTAAAIRQRIHPSGRWLMLREWFAESPREVYRKLRDHPYSQRYGLFEFPYPAWYYIRSLELVGYELEVVVPPGYRRGALAAHVDMPVAETQTIQSRFLEQLIAVSPVLTRLAYRVENAVHRLDTGRGRRFTRPAALVFRRREVRM